VAHTYGGPGRALIAGLVARGPGGAGDGNGSGTATRRRGPNPCHPPIALHSLTRAECTSWPLSPPLSPGLSLTL
jgi:hypothetical protein